MTKTTEVQGLYYDGNDAMSMVKGNVTVRFTSDNMGKTLSLAFEDKCQITVPAEPIQTLLAGK